MLQVDATNCGIHHLYHLGGCNSSDKIQANNVMYNLLKSVYDKPMGLCCFNDNVDAHNNSNGRVLAKVIEENKLGVIVAGPVAPNPVHNNQTHIQAWVWAVDKVAIWMWLEKNKPQILLEQEAEKERLKKEAEARVASRNAEYAKKVIKEFRPKLDKPMPTQILVGSPEWLNEYNNSGMRIT